MIYFLFVLFTPTPPYKAEQRREMCVCICVCVHVCVYSKHNAITLHTVSDISLAYCPLQHGGSLDSRLVPRALSRHLDLIGPSQGQLHSSTLYAGRTTLRQYCITERVDRDWRLV